MPTTPCFALATTFAGQRLRPPAVCVCGAPRAARRPAVRRVYAAADPEAPDAPEQALDVLEGAPPPGLPPTDAPAEPDPAPEAEPEDEQPADEPVPGKIVLTELEIAEQRRELERYAEELRRQRIAEEREAARLFGWVPYAETLNGRLAMFFFVTGLLTEYWTGYSIPEQIELMARTLGIL